MQIKWQKKVSFVKYNRCPQFRSQDSFLSYFLCFCTFCWVLVSNKKKALFLFFFFYLVVLFNLSNELTSDILLNHPCANKTSLNFFLVFLVRELLLFLSNFFLRYTDNWLVDFLFFSSSKDISAEFDLIFFFSLLSSAMEQSAPCTPEAGPLNTTRESDNMVIFVSQWCFFETLFLNQTKGILYQFFFLFDGFVLFYKFKSIRCTTPEVSRLLHLAVWISRILENRRALWPK